CGRRDPCERGGARLHRDAAGHDHLRGSGRARRDRGPDPDGPARRPGGRRGDHGLPRERRRRLRHRRALPRRRRHDLAVTPAGQPGPAHTAAEDLAADGVGADCTTHAARTWSSGRWALEARGDELADLRCDGHVVLRAVRGVARDVDWATGWPRGVSLESGADALTLDLRIHDLGLDLAGTLRVAADGDRLRIDLDLTALSDSPTNRVGLVVLHPPQLA